MRLMLSKGQAQVKWDNLMKMLHERRATHVCHIKLGQIFKWKLVFQNGSCLAQFCSRIPKISFSFTDYNWKWEKMLPKKSFGIPLPDFITIAEPKIRILIWNLASRLLSGILFFINRKFRILWAFVLKNGSSDFPGQNRRQYNKNRDTYFAWRPILPILMFLGWICLKPADSWILHNLPISRKTTKRHVIKAPFSQKKVFLNFGGRRHIDGE